MVLMASIMVSLSVFLLVFAIFVRQRRYRAEVAARLSVFAEASEASDVLAAEPAPQRSRFAGLRSLERALKRMNVGRGLAVRLERAGLSMRVSEFLLVQVAAALVPAALVMVTVGLPLAAAVVAVPGFFAPLLWLRWRHGRRLARIEKQLPEALGSMASGLRAGFGLMHAMQATSQTLSDPLAGELAATIREMQLGAGVDDALANLSERVGSYDLNIVITAIRVQQRTGGNLAEILDKVAYIMRERDRIRGELKTMTSQQRLSGLILTVLPVALAALLTLLNPGYMRPLFTETLGRAMIAGAAVMNVVGFLIIRKILAIRL